MIESVFRPAFQRIFIQPVVHTPVHFVHPNAITLLSLITGIISAVLLGFDMALLSIAMLLISGYLDILDGSIARFKNKSTSFGTLLDILSDRMVESAIVIALFIRDPALALICLLMLVSMLLCVSSFLLVGIFSEKQGSKSFYYSPGLMERAEAFAFFIAMILLPKFTLILGGLFVLLVLWTTIYRVYQFYQQSKEQ